MTPSVGIVGFRGYSGEELVRILTRHGGVALSLLEHRADSPDATRPRGSQGPPRISCTPAAVREAGLAVVFLATPPEVSLDLAPWLLEGGARVIDLSGAFRLRTVDNYRRWYKEEHPQAELLREAVYGLPEFYREQVPAARLVSNPGCYPTAANLALRPLVAAGLVDRAGGIVCDAKSGVSGAGRKPSLKTSFCEVTENFSAYSILDHRHVPEVLLHSSLEEREFSFTAQLLPLHRGILETIYFRLAAGKQPEDLSLALERAYAGEPFVRLYHHGQAPDLRAVQRTNFCDLGWKVDAASGRAVVVSAIDNLGKGAAGQAVQNMNLMLGFPGNAGAAFVKILIKLGGTLLDGAAEQNRLCEEITALRREHQIVVVHGGGKQMSRFLDERGVESRFLDGLRVTTPEVLDAVLKVLAGSVNHQLVASFVSAGALAVGLTGIDALLTEAQQLRPELGAVGRVVRADGRLLDTLTANGYLPVVACVAAGRTGEIYNVNADQMAVACAAAFQCDRLFFLTDVEGVKGRDGWIDVLTPSGCEQLIRDGIATGGMQAKLNAACDALAQGVGEVVIVHGARPGVVQALLSGERAGTRLRKDGAG